MLEKDKQSTSFLGIFEARYKHAYKISKENLVRLIEKVKRIYSFLEIESNLEAIKK